MSTKGIKNIISVFVVFLTSFQLAFAESLSRLPASIHHEHSLDLVFDKINDFGERLSGKDIELGCNGEQISEAGSWPANEDQNHDQLESFLFGGMNIISSPENSDTFFGHNLERFEKNACSMSMKTWTAQSSSSSSLSQQEGDECHFKRVSGFIDDLIAEALELESQEREPEVLSLENLDFKAFYDEAKRLNSYVRNYVQDRRVSVEDRQDLLINYLENVLMPMRDTIVLMRSYQNQKGNFEGGRFYQNLLLNFPQELLEQGAWDFEDRVTMGPNPSADPFYLRLHQRGHGSIGILFNEVEIISRDILTLMRAPTSDNYLQAVKWMTLQMMLSQVFVYDSILGEQRSTQIPRSCQMQVGEGFPSEVNFEFVDGRGEEFIDNILASHGLSYNGNNYEYIEYYLENMSKDPTEDGYSGLLPFEKYRNAQQGLSVRRGHLAPSFDDMTYFDRILDIRLPRAQQRYSSVRQGGRGQERRQYIYDDVELLDKIVSQPAEMTVYEIIDEHGNEIHIDPRRQNLSTYLVEVMQREGVLGIEEILSRDLEQKLKSTELSLDFPTLYGSAVWRNWGMMTLKEYLKEKIETDSFDRATTRAINRACQINMASPYGGPPGASPANFNIVGEICRSEDNGAPATAERLVNYLDKFSFDNPYLPAQRIDEARLETIYPLVTSMWEQLRDRSDFTEAKPSEYDFLMGQMRAHNPWARVRLGYLVAMDEMLAQRDGHELVRGITRRGSRVTQNSRCFYDNVDGLIDRLSSAAKDLGVDRPLNPGHGTSLLSRREKESVWRNYLDETNEANSQLFTVRASNGEDYYTLFENLSFVTLLTENQVEDYLSHNNIRLNRADRETLDEVLDSSLARQGADYLEIYKSKGDLDRQVEIFERVAREHGVSSEFSAKLNFLTLNDELKRPLFSSMIKDAARERRSDIVNNLHEFCSYQTDDFESFRAMFYMTTKAHNNLNQMAGLSSVPESVMKRLEGGFMGMSPGETKNMMMALGVMALAIGAIVIGATCSGLTGGLCAPLSVAMIGAGVGAFALQIKLVQSELELKNRADDSERRVQMMEDLGFAELGSSDNVSRTWLWTALEATIVIPLIGIVTRSVSLGTRLSVVSAKSIAQRSGKVAFQRNAQRAVQEAEVGLARYVLGFDSLSGTFREGYRASARTSSERLSQHLSNAGVPREKISSTLNQFDNISSLYQRGQLTTRQFMTKVGEILSPVQRSFRGVRHMLAKDFQSVAVRESVRTIDQRTAKVVAEYFGNNPHHLQRLLNSYGGKRLDKAIQTQQRLQSQQGSGVPVLGPIRRWIVNKRTEQLATNAPKLRRLKSELAQVQRSGQSLERFILNNLDDFTDIFLHIPMRKRELPYLVFWLGAPHLGIKRVPIMAEIADGIIVKKFFTARARLVHESLKSQARQTLGLPTLVNSESTYAVIKAFDQSISQSSDRLSANQLRQMSQKYAQFQDDAFVHLRQTVAKSKNTQLSLPNGQSLGQLDDQSLRRLLFSPSNASERAIAEAIWEATPAEQILNSQNLNQIAHKAALELSNYRNADEFDRFLGALKLLTLKRNPAVVDFF